MILYVLCHKNEKIDCFTQPIFVDVEPEKVAIQEARTLKTCDIKAAMPYKNLVLFELGTFDDQTGDAKLHKPRFLADVGKIVVDRLEEAGVKDVESKIIDR